METQLFVWTIVALIGVAALSWRVVTCLHSRQCGHHRMIHVAKRSHNGARHPHHHFIELGHESEEFFVAGDRLVKGDYDYDEADDM